MKLLFTSDLHGKGDFYQEILYHIKTQKCDGLILGGDLLPRHGHNYDSLKIQEHFILNEIRPFLFHIKMNLSFPVMLILGNNDWACTLAQFKELQEEDLIVLLHDTSYRLSEDLMITGYPFIPPTPFSPKDFEKKDCKTDTPRLTSRTPVACMGDGPKPIDERRYFQERSSIQEDLAKMPLPANHENIIYVFHAPPYDTRLDQVYDGSHLGSRAIRNFVEKVQPYMTLHGHIHESTSITRTFWQKIGDTISMSSGQTGPRLSAVIFDPHQPAETYAHTLIGNQ